MTFRFHFKHKAEVRVVRGALECHPLQQVRGISAPVPNASHSCSRSRRLERVSAPALLAHCLKIPGKLRARRVPPRLELPLPSDILVIASRQGLAKRKPGECSVEVEPHYHRRLRILRHPFRYCKAGHQLVADDNES
jgi:hypothetical protein